MHDGRIVYDLRFTIPPGYRDLRGRPAGSSGHRHPGVRGAGRAGCAPAPAGRAATRLASAFACVAVGPGAPRAKVYLFSYCMSCLLRVGFSYTHTPLDKAYALYPLPALRPLHPPITDCTLASIKFLWRERPH